MTAKPAAYRHRLLGVFDELTGEPIAGVEVADSTSGTFATTTATGTVSLAFLPEGLSTLRIRKLGYAELHLPVVISPKDSLPITLTLGKPK
jgi:Carboxypeptidase regulatory-like domain